MLAREVRRLRGIISREKKWDVVVDLFFYRDPEEAEKDEAAAKEMLPAPKVVEGVHEIDTTEDTGNWGDDVPAIVPPPVAAVVPPAADDWNEEEPVGASWGGGGGF